jgi:large subunit ribosomal protein L6
MSRIGQLPIAIPEGVEVNFDGGQVHVKGKKGELTRMLPAAMKVEVADGVAKVLRPSESREHRSLHGLSRTLVANMVHGVSEGFTKELEMVGVGYRAAKSGNDLQLFLGYSHPIRYIPPADIQIDVPQPTLITISGADKETVGAVAAKIRSFREPEPYKGKGVKYKDEVIRRKAGKAGKAKATATK